MSFQNALLVKFLKLSVKKKIGKIEPQSVKSIALHFS